MTQTRDKFLCLETNFLFVVAYGKNDSNYTIFERLKNLGFFDNYNYIYIIQNAQLEFKKVLRKRLKEVSNDLIKFLSDYNIKTINKEVLINKLKQEYKKKTLFKKFFNIARFFNTAITIIEELSDPNGNFSIENLKPDNIYNLYKLLIGSIETKAKNLLSNISFIYPLKTKESSYFKHKEEIKKVFNVLTNCVKVKFIKNGKMENDYLIVEEIMELTMENKLLHSVDTHFLTFDKRLIKKIKNINRECFLPYPIEVIDYEHFIKVQP